MSKTYIVDALGRGRLISYKYRYARLGLGKHFYVRDPAKFNSIRATLSKFQKRTGKYFATKKTARGLKITRWT